MSIGPTNAVGMDRRGALRSLWGAATAAVLGSRPVDSRAQGQFLNANQRLRFTYGNPVSSYYNSRRNAYLGTGYLARTPRLYPYLPSYPRFYPNGSPGGLRFFFPYRGSNFYFGAYPGFYNYNGYGNYSNYNSSGSGRSNSGGANSSGSGRVASSNRQGGTDCPVRIDPRLQAILDKVKTELADDPCVKIGARDQVLDNVLSFYLMPSPLAYLRVVNELESGNKATVNEFHSLEFFNKAIQALDRITENDRFADFKKYKSDYDALAKLYGEDLDTYHLENQVFAYNRFTEREQRDLALALHPDYVEDRHDRIAKEKDISKEETKANELNVYKAEYGDYDSYVESVKALNEKNKAEKILTITQIGSLAMTDEETRLFEILRDDYFAELKKKKPIYEEMQPADFILANIVKLYMRMPHEIVDGNRDTVERKNAIRILENIASGDKEKQFNEQLLLSTYHTFALLRNRVKELDLSGAAKSEPEPAPQRLIPAESKQPMGFASSNLSVGAPTPALLLA